MKKSKAIIGAAIAGVILVGGTIGVLSCTEKIAPGYVGVVYSMNGGIQDDVLNQGWHIVSPFKKVTSYSIATEQLYLSKDVKEGSADDDSFDVMCKDGKMNVDLEMSYSFDAERVTDVYTRYRGLSGEEVISNIVRGKVKTFTNEVTSQYTVLEAHMEKKAELNTKLTEHLKAELDTFGIVVESANLTRTDVDETIEKAITERAKASQELEIERQKKAKAELEAERKLIEAQAEADAKIIEAKAEAEANKLINETLTNEMVQKMWIEKWDGKQPQVSSNATPIIKMNE